MAAKGEEWMGVLKLPREVWCEDAYNQCLCLTPRHWRRKLVECREVPEWTNSQDLSLDELRCSLLERTVPNEDWVLLIAEFVADFVADARYLPHGASTFTDAADDTRSPPPPQLCGDEATYSTLLRRVALENVTARWQHYRNKHNVTACVGEGAVVAELVTASAGELLARAHCRPPLNVAMTTDPHLSQSADTLTGDCAADISDASLWRALAVLRVAAGHVVVYNHSAHRLSDCATFASHHFLNNSAKALFVGYQLLRAARQLHNRVVPLGDARGAEVAINRELWVRVRPRLASIIQRQTHNIGPQSGGKYSCVASDGDCSASAATHLHQLTQLWAEGGVSNLDYLLALNEAVGRKVNDPAHHAVVPWVTDLTRPAASADAGAPLWRPLHLSKYRLNKGDTQLERQYSAACAHGQPAYHISDVLSEITYYVYMARRTPRSVLCHHVRSQWEPAEYPGSMCRLYEWTPDECIPQFYTDTAIFQSVHADLADLQLPDWADSAASFISDHRGALESPHVSSQLHHWIDLTFGYKLSGCAAVAAKNVCRHLVTAGSCSSCGAGASEMKVTRSGVVQLFYSPHPRRRSGHVHRPPPTTAPSVLISAAAGQLRPALANWRAVNDDGEMKVQNSKFYDVTVDDTVLTSSAADSAQVLLEDLRAVESMAGHLGPLATSGGRSKKHSAVSPHMSRMCQISSCRDAAVCLCLLVETVLPHQFRHLLADQVTMVRAASLSARLTAAITAAHSQHAPLFVRHLSSTLRQLRDIEECVSLDGAECMCSSSRPLPTVKRLLDVHLSPVAWPAYIAAFYRMTCQFECCRADHERALQSHGAGSTEEMEAAEHWVCEFSAAVLQLFDGWQLSADWLQLVVSLLVRQLREPSCGALVTWQLFSVVARRLAPAVTVHRVLPALLQLYQPHNLTSKSMKLFHRTLLTHLLARLGHRVFMRHVTPALINVLLPDLSSGDLTDLHHGSTTSHTATSRQVRPACDSMDRGKAGVWSQHADVRAEMDETGALLLHQPRSQLKSRDSQPAHPACNTNSSTANNDNVREFRCHIADVAMESVLWLAHRVGPLLSCRHLSSQLLRSATLCYSLPAAFRPATMPGNSGQRLYAVHRRADVSAARLYVCLRGIAELYGQSVVACQYVPHAVACVTGGVTVATSGAGVGSGSKRVCARARASLMAALSLLLHLLPCLGEAVFMDCLQESVVNSVLVPVAAMLQDSSILFHPADSMTGGDVRKAIGHRWLRLVAMVTQRVGLDIALTLFGHVVSEFVANFATVQGACGSLARGCDTAPLSTEHTLNTTSLAQLRMLFDADLAAALYGQLCHLLSNLRTNTSDSAHVQLVWRLCSSNKSSNVPSEHHSSSLSNISDISTCSPKSSSQPVCLSQTGFVLQGGGNRIDLTQEQRPDNQFVQKGGTVQRSTTLYQPIPDELCRYKMTSDVRHLRGDWLAYWRAELNPVKVGGGGGAQCCLVRQICLQRFDGHCGGVRRLHVLDSENSFLSASKDRTVKLWSLRSQGDGSHRTTARWTYSQHRRPLCDVTYVGGIQRAISCDSHQLHVWDPFVAACDSIVDNLGTIQGVCQASSDCRYVFVATAECVIKLLDLRTLKIAAEWKTWPSHIGRLSCMTSSGDVSNDSWLAAGHTHGGCTLLDVRSGRVISSWKAHDAEIVKMSCLSAGTHDAVAGVMHDTDGVAADDSNLTSCSHIGGAHLLVTCCLDNTVAAWNCRTACLSHHIRGMSESVQSVSARGRQGQLVATTSSGRLVLLQASQCFSHLPPEGATASSVLANVKLTQDCCKGLVCSHAVLPANNLLLLGSDTGSIHLVY